MKLFINGSGILAPDRVETGELGGLETPMARLSPRSESRLDVLGPRYEECDRSSRLALVTSRAALSEAGWAAADAVFIGASRGATGLLEESHREFLRFGRVPTKTSPLTTIGNISTLVANDIQSGDVAGDLSVTCGTALHAIQTGVAFLRAGMVGRVLAGGAEAPLTAFTIAQMTALRIYSTRTGDPYPCRPCAASAGRENTMVLGEGAGVFALSSEPGPVALLGIGSAMESVSSLAGVSKSGEGMRRAIERALAEAGIRKPDVVVLHAPGTLNGDAAETNAIHALWGDDLPALVTPKWRFGHTLAASGALGIAVARELLEGRPLVSFAAPFEQRIPRCEQPVVGSPSTVLVNAFGFGGNSCAIVLGVGRPSR